MRPAPTTTAAAPSGPGSDSSDGEDGEEERSQGAAAPLPLDPLLTADNQFIVSEIVDFREKPRLQYLCKWLGYPDSEKTWEPVENIDPGLVRAPRPKLMSAAARGG